MIMSRVSITSVWVAFFVAACSSSTPNSSSQNSQQGGTGGGTSNPIVQPKLVTSAANAYWIEGTPTEVTSDAGAADVTVDSSTTYQTWDGFGGAFNEKGWSYLSTLSQSDRDLALNLLFGANGCHFAFGRIPIGASDYAMDRYTLDETANDYSMASFSIDRDKQKLIPYVQAALAVKPDIRLWGSPWTPPTWMKSAPYTTPANVTSAFDGGTMKSDAQTLQAFALYLAKFVQEYAKVGIKIEAVAPQNEPNYAQNYPSALWATATYDTFIGTYLGPTFATQNVTANILLGTMSNGESGKDPAIVTAVLGDATAMKYIKGVGMQWGMESDMNAVIGKNLPVWQTEHKCGNYPWASGYQTTAPNDQAYAVETWGLIEQWIKDGVNAYSAWNMVLDKVGLGIDTTRDWAQDALLVVDGGKLTPTPAYYVFRHLSQFVVPGATRIGTTGGDALAFKNPDGTIVTVMYNSGAARTAIVDVGSTKLQFDMPANGWATVNWK